MLSINYQTENIIVDHLPIMVCWSTNYPQKSFSIKVYKGAELVSLIAREGNNTIVTLDAISLQSFTSYTIEVLTHGDNGENNVFRNSFTTSNLGHFSGRWVSGGHHFTNDIHYYRGKRNVVMRKTIYLDEDLLDAYISIVGLGFYKLYINGKEVTRGELNTDWTNYAKIIYYDTYNIKPFINQPKNEVIVELADGWFNPAPLKLFGKYNLRETLTIGEPQVIADIYMKFADREMIIGSDADWQYCEGAYTFNNIYLGERLDMKLFRGENTTDLLMPDWKNVVLSNGPEGRLVSSFIPKINHTLSLGAEHIHVVDEETFIIDFGAIVTGFIDLSITASENQRVELLYSEDVDENYELNTDSTLAGFVGKQVTEGVIIDGGIGAPARAEQKDAFECRSGKNHFINAFTCHSFRYVQLSGINIEQLNNVQALSVHTVLRENGGFYCSDPYINKLFEVAKRTKLNNIHSVFGDCARERFAYGGDIVALARSQVYQFDSAAIYKKTIFDFINDIRPCGGVTETAPFMGIKTNGVGGETGPLGWQLVLPYLIAIHYRHYGNVNLLAESLPFLEKQILSLEMRDFDDLVTCCLGDWGSRVHDMRNYKNGSPALHFTSACFYYYHLLIIAKICDDLGFKEKWLKYIGKANKIREKILSLYKNTDGSFADRSQTSFVFAIYFDLCDDIESSLNALIDLIKKEQNVITCGIFGQSFAYEIFHRYGHNELILEWLRVEAGFKKMLKNDASTLKEFFGDNLNGSNNHAMFSSYSSWLFQALGGITVAEEAVGADVILISPSFTDTINFVDCWHQTIRGRIECRWRRYKKGIELVIKVPFNLKKCTLKLPKVYQLNKQLPAPIDCDTYHHFYDITDAGEIKVLL